MIVKGKYASAEIFTENIEDAALQWVKEQCDHPAFDGVKIVQMPDVHAGSSCNVGTVYRIGEHVNPDHVGVDIGCTVSMHRLSSVVVPEDFALLNYRIRDAIPSGMAICAKSTIDERDLFRFLDSQYRKARSAAPDLIRDVARIDARFVADLCRRIRLQEGIFYKSLGTLGGGNHFIEYGENCAIREGWLTIHCGSRNLGAKVAAYWHGIAQNPARTRFAGYLCGDALVGYLSDMVVAQAYALYNHHLIRDRIFAILSKLSGVGCEESIFTTHNYISVYEEHPMLRKGAVKADRGERFCLPFNMRDGIAICEGKGNADWNCSAPHGTGRSMSRNAARKSIEMKDFEESMAGIFSTSVCADTLDESPQAYKPADEILSLVEPAARVVALVKPRINIKDIPR